MTISGIYCIENMNNNKKYIGKSIDVKKRWQQHRRDLKKRKHRNIHLQNSWDLYGEDSFNFYILEKCEPEDLFLEELYCIKIFKTTNDKFGYNMTGSSQNEIDYNESYLETMRNVQKARPIYQISLDGDIIKYWEHGCRHASKVLNIMFSNIYSCCVGKMSTAYNYIWVFEEDYSEKNILERLKNMKNQSIVQLTIDYKYIKTWDSLLSAANGNNLDPSSIAKTCNHIYATTGRYRWEYEYNYKNNALNKKLPKVIEREVVQLDMNLNVIKVWPKIAGIHMQLGKEKDNGGIKACCEGKKKSTYGYKWMYYDEYKNKIEGSITDG